MDSLALRTFLDIAQTRSFSRSAERLHLSQPAVSKRIANLEQQLGMPLLDRVGRQVLLTDAGHALLPHAKKVLQTLDDAQSALSHLSDTVGGRLSIGTSHHIGLHRLPPVLRQFSQQFPAVDLDLHFMDSEIACEQVLAGDLELAVVTLPPQAPEQLNCEELWPDPLVVVVNREHPLCEHKELKLDDLAQFPAVLPDEKTYTHRIIRQALAQADASPRVRLASNYLETLKMLVSIGLGWSVLPRSMLGTELIELEMQSLRLQRHLGLVRRRDRTESSAAAQFYRLARQYANT